MFSKEMVITHPECIPEIKKEAKATLELIGYCETLCRLRKYLDWDKFDWSVMSTWANKVDEPFVKLMISLAKNGYQYNVISMHKWWRRLKAVNQQHIIGYFSYQGFPKPKEITQTIWWDLLYAQCCKTKSVFEEFNKVYQDDTFVEMNLRALLGISTKSDIKEAWHKWTMTNHPDKGGSVEKFVLVKAAYEEYLLSTR